MNSTSPSRFDFSKPITRREFIGLLNTALSVKEYRFVRQGALAWLAIFPGDLFINYLLANGFIGEGKVQQAGQILDKVVNCDPEFWQARDLLSSVCPKLADPNLNNPGRKADWEKAIETSQKAILNNQLELAEELVLKAMQAQPDSVIPAIHHIRVTHASNNFKSVEQLATVYHGRWPECLQISLFLAEARIVQGDETSAVALLHQCVAKDPSGQVPTRIWGPAYPYRPLWPDRMEIQLDMPIPGPLAMAMGWNQLVPGEPVGPAPIEDEAVSLPKSMDGEADIADEVIVVNPEVDPFEITAFSQEEANAPQTADETLSNPDQAPDEVDQSQIEALIQASTTSEAYYGEFIIEEEAPVKEVETPPQTESPQPVPDLTLEKRAPDEELRSIQTEFERLAKNIKRPAVGRTDGRFPMYIVFSSRQNLEKKYGEQTAAVLDEEMRRLVNAVRKRPGWGAILFYPDDPATTTALGLKPVQSNDPWKLKLSLADLDKALLKRGEMIGAVFIMGGPDVIPFHHLPNPTDDNDLEVLSDNPYATTDDNYFIPEWPVGRLPGAAGSDAGMLLETLRRLATYHEDLTHRHPFWRRNQFIRGLTRSIHGFLFNVGLVKGTRPSFGYTAQVWRSSSTEVFRPVGQPPSMLACPPTQAGTWNNGKLPAYMGYFNLHGIEDAVEWYGQKGPGSDPDVPDYPVAICPTDIQGSRQAPGIIFSEACYGGLIENKKEDEALVYRFLSMGTYGLVGSTCVSYGSLSSPLIAADLLGFYFWQQIRQGQTVGNALLRAKLKLAKEMNHRQGYLDGEDQKTLLSFVLYGDPLAILDEYRPQQPKAIYRTRHHPVVKMISDDVDKYAVPEKMPEDMLEHVKQIVTDYLPGLQDAELSLIQQHCNCLKGNPTCGACQFNAKSVAKGSPKHYVVSLSKDVKVSKQVHHHFARMTLDPQGKVLKLTTSR